MERKSRLIDIEPDFAFKGTVNIDLIGENEREAAHKPRESCP
jgi:hypothetical protein